MPRCTTILAALALTCNVYAQREMVIHKSDGSTIIERTAQIDSITFVQGLVAYYPFNGDAQDESGNGRDATVNGATLTEDRFGHMDQAYSFDGVDDFVEGTNVIPNYENATISVWVKSSVIPENVVRGIVSKPRSQTGGGFRLGVKAASGSGDLGFNNGEVNLSRATTDPITDGSWHHLVGTVSGGVATLYLDGVEASRSNTFTTSDITSSVNLQIGREMPAGEYRYVDAAIDDVRVYDRALTAAEVQALYREGGWSTP